MMNVFNDMIEMQTKLTKSWSDAFFKLNTGVFNYDDNLTKDIFSKMYINTVKTTNLFYDYQKELLNLTFSNLKEFKK